MRFFCYRERGQVSVTVAIKAGKRPNGRPIFTAPCPNCGAPLLRMGTAVFGGTVGVVDEKVQLDAVIRALREKIEELSPDPAEMFTFLSPDAWNEREGAKGDLEEVLEIAEGRQPA